MLTFPAVQPESSSYSLSGGGHSRIYHSHHLQKIRNSQSTERRRKRRRGETRMEKASLLLVGALTAFILLGVCDGIESPQFTVIHTESDFEIRLYRDSIWMSAPVEDISFEKATKFGFHRLFQYIQGANMNYSRIPMTKPVLTTIVPGAGPLHSSAYHVRFYLPVKFQEMPPVLLAELNLKLSSWTSHCVAVRKFSGFARDSNIVMEAEKLAVSLGRSPWANSTSSVSKYAYSIAQYDSPFRFITRVNEVWVDVSGSDSSRCGSNGLAAY